jgi:probable phosphoglycerate mutase
MHSIYFARHGETVWNVENKICGMTDSPLTEKGRQQARELGRKVKESGVHIDEILYSPLSRAADTAKAVAEATGLPARCEPRLREQCFGKYEGTPRDGAEFRISKTHFADRYVGGESMMQLAQRTYNLLTAAELADLLNALPGGEVGEGQGHGLVSGERAVGGNRGELRNPGGGGTDACGPELVPHVRLVAEAALSDAQDARGGPNAFDLVGETAAHAAPLFSW